MGGWSVERKTDKEKNEPALDSEQIKAFYWFKVYS